MTTYQQTYTERITNCIVKGLTVLLSKVDAAQLSQVPKEGPLILVTNHINFLEAPIIYTRLSPRPITGFAKIESWDSAFLGWLFDIWDIIPIHRGEADTTAIKAGLKALENGFILTIAPEGTRSGKGILGKGHPGVVLMAGLSEAPMLPIAHYGHQNYREDFRKLHRTPFHVVVGQPFRLKSKFRDIAKDERQKVVDEIMYQIAALLPQQHRGVYSNLSAASEDYLEFTPPATSNLAMNQI